MMMSILIRLCVAAEYHRRVKKGVDVM